jgi:hypothetical protein
VKHRSMLALLSGVALAAAGTGASHALVSMPLMFIVAFGASGALLALTQSRRPGPVAALVAGGAMLGAMLPRTAPLVAGSVVAQPVLGRGGDLFALLDQIDADPRTVLGRRVSVSGEWSAAVGLNSATVSERVMACCAADAVRVGFDVAPLRPLSLAEGAPVRVTGILAVRLSDGNVRYTIVRASVRR